MTVSGVFLLEKCPIINQIMQLSEFRFLFSSSFFFFRMMSTLCWSQGTYFPHFPLLLPHGPMRKGDPRALSSTVFSGWSGPPFWKQSGQDRISADPVLYQRLGIRIFHKNFIRVSGPYTTYKTLTKCYEFSASGWNFRIQLNCTRTLIFKNLFCIFLKFWMEYPTVQCFYLCHEITSSTNIHKSTAQCWLTDFPLVSPESHLISRISDISNFLWSM